jgi:hypothetical protein
MEHVKIARLESFVRKMMQLPHRAVHVKLGNTWVVVVPSIVWIAILERTKTVLAPPSVKRVKKAVIKFCLEINHASIVMLGNTWAMKVPSIVWIAIQECTKTNRVRPSAKCVYKIRLPM